MERFTKEEMAIMCHKYTMCTQDSILNNGVTTPYLKEVNPEDLTTLTDLANVWSLLFFDMTGSEMLAFYIRKRGIIEMISESTSLMDTFIHQEFDLTLLKTGSPWFFLRKLEVSDILLALGFPKRVRITGCDLGQVATEKFIANNVRMKNPIVKNKLSSYKTNGFTRFCFLPDHLTYSFLLEMKKVIAEALNDKDIPYDMFIMPPGSTYEGDRTYVDKYVTLSKNRDWLVSEYGWRRDLFLDRPQTPIRFRNRLITVPKNWKAMRTVCPEEVSRQVIGYNIANYLGESLLNMEDCEIHVKFGKDRNLMTYLLTEFGHLSHRLLKTKIIFFVPRADVHDQSVNQLLALVGSLDGSVATVDFTSASDSISVDLCRLILPKWLFEDIMKIRATHCEIGKKVIKLNTMCTMGHSVTFNLETLIFLAGAIASGRLMPFGSHSNSILAFAYGDDVVLDSQYADFFCMMMSRIGFIPNMEKTFIDGPYRESCGKEYFQGIDVSHAFWPRGTSSSHLAELISLQQKLFNRPHTNTYLCEQVSILRPSVSTSEPNTEGSDIWLPGGTVTKPSLSPYAVEAPSLLCTDTSGKTEAVPISLFQGLSYFGENIYYSPDRTRVYIITRVYQPKMDVFLWKCVERVNYNGLLLSSERVADRFYTEIKYSRYKTYGTKSKDDQEPYRLATVITNQVRPCKDKDRREMAEQLAYALRISALQHKLYFDVDDFHGPYRRKTNRILPDQLIDSLCSESFPVYQEKVVFNSAELG